LHGTDWAEIEGRKTDFVCFGKKVEGDELHLLGFAAGAIRTRHRSQDFQFQSHYAINAEPGATRVHFELAGQVCAKEIEAKTVPMERVFLRSLRTQRLPRFTGATMRHPNRGLNPDPSACLVFPQPGPYIRQDKSGQSRQSGKFCRKRKAMNKSYDARADHAIELPSASAKDSVSIRSFPPRSTEGDRARLKSRRQDIYLVDCRFDDSIELLKQGADWFA